MARDERKSKGGLFMLIASAVGAGILFAVNSQKAKAAENEGVHLVILDEYGNPVQRSLAPSGGPVGRGPVMAGSRVNLTPGSYTAQVILKNNSTKGGSPTAASLNIEVSSTISGLMTAVDQDIAFSASEQKTLNYPFTVTAAMMNTSGTITVSVKTPSGVSPELLLDSDYISVSIIPPTGVVSAPVLDNLFKTGVSGMPLDLKNGDSWWGQVHLTHQYNGGNYSVYVEILVGDQAWRSYADFTLEDTATLLTKTITTANQDLFNAGDIPYLGYANVRVSLWYRGDGSDWSLSQLVGTPTVYTSKVRVVEPDYTPYFASVRIKIPATGSWVDAVNGMSGTYNSTYSIMSILRLNALSQPGVTTTCTLKITKPSGTVTTLAYSNRTITGDSTTGIWEVYADWLSQAFDQYGTYTFLITVTYGGTAYTAQFTVVVAEPPIVYGADVTIT